MPKVDPSRIAVIEDSAVGELTGAVLLLARDRQSVAAAAMQLLIYPMLDDRVVEEKKLEGLRTTSHINTRTSWNAYIWKDVAYTEVVSPCATVP